MNTILDAATAVFKLVNVASVKNVITGGIYKYRRPQNSNKEDIVINTPSLGSGTRQLGVVNVNIYVPDVQQSIDGKNVFLVNTARLETLTNLVKPLIEETDGEAYVIMIENFELFDESDINYHFMNIRLRIQMYNHH